MDFRSCHLSKLFKTKIIIGIMKKGAMSLILVMILLLVLVILLFFIFMGGLKNVFQ